MNVCLVTMYFGNYMNIDFNKLSEI